MPIARNHSTIQKIVQKGKKKVGAICQEIELQIIFRKGEIFFFNQIVVPDKSRSSYMGFAPPSACLLTAADSLLSLFPITAVDGGRSDHRRRQRFCHNCVTNWKKGQRPQVVQAACSKGSKGCVSEWWQGSWYRANKRTTDERTERREQRTDGRDSTVDYRRLDCGTKAGRNNDGLSVLARLMTVMECFFSKWQGKCN